MKEKEEHLEYILVQGNYFKNSKKPCLNGKEISLWIPWPEKRLKLDLSKEEILSIPRFDGFCYIPNHLQHERNFGLYFNRYESLPHNVQEGKIDTTVKFLKYLYEDQYEIILDYLQIIYTKPLQKLPALCLVSKERGTGKTTFLNWMKHIFHHNMTYNSNEDFRSQFNSGWVNKLLIGIDEVLLDNEEDAERIKNLITASKYNSEAKGKDRTEEEFFGKFILCSNNETNFIKIGIGEDRFWVRKIKASENKDIFLADKLRKEIPAFLFFLLNRKLHHQNKSRLYFDPKITHTKALQRVINSTSSRYEKQLIYLLNEIAESTDQEVLYYAPKDIKALCNIQNITINNIETRDFLKRDLDLKPKQNSSNYTKFLISKSGSISSYMDKGRYYSIPMVKIKKIIDDFDE